MLAKLWTFVLLAGFLLVGTVLLWFSAPLRYSTGPTPNDVAASVKAALPNGSSQDKVLAFLDKQRIEHSAYLPSERKIYAIRRNTCRALFVECSIDMIFSFDETATLTDVSVKEGLTGL